MTHADALARFPIREVFPAGRFGEAFAAAKDRAADLGLFKIDGTGTGGNNEPDGQIVPGLSDDDPPVPKLARWLGAVTLYYRPRAATSGGSDAR